MHEWIFKFVLLFLFSVRTGRTIKIQLAFRQALAAYKKSDELAFEADCKHNSILEFQCKWT